MPTVNSAIEVELLKASKCPKKKPGEDLQKYLTRLMRAVYKLNEDDWEELTEEAKGWYNDAAENAKGGRKLGNFPDYDGPEIEEEPEEEKEEEVAPPPKAQTKPRKTSACHVIKTLVAKKPDISVEAISEKLKASDMKVSNVTIATLRSDTRDTLRVLNELGIGEFKL